MSTTAVTSVEEWGKAGVHSVLCPSGARVDIKIPDLPAIIEAGELPQHLLDAAIGVATGNGGSTEPSKELISKEREFTDVLVSLMVVSPQLSAEDARLVPYEDKEMLIAIATRQRDLDAEGEHIGGLSKSAKFRRFRKLGEFDTPLADL